MTYPVNPITISYSYSDFQLGQGNNNFPGTQIDADLATITNSINSLNTFVRGVTRSDGKLANQSVGPDQLSAALNVGFTLQGPWASGFAYSTSDGVIYNGNFYRALFAHTSTGPTRPDLSPATWQFLFSIGTVVGAMTAAVYDPQNKVADAFARANHTGTQAISTITGLLAALGVYAAKSTNYTAVLADNNAVHRFTGAATVILTGAATLGPSWSYTIVADGGDVIVDANGTETINGGLTLLVPNGASAKIICDGTGFFTIFKPRAWEVISEANFTGAAALDFTNLSAFRKLRLTGNASLSSAVGLYLLTSSNNGSSFDNGASDYSIQNTGAQGAALTPTSAVSTALNISSPVGVDASTQATFSVIINIFNVAVTGPHVLSQFMGFKGGSIFSEFNAGLRNSAVARNALRLFPGAGTMTGNVTLEGIRG